MKLPLPASIRGLVALVVLLALLPALGIITLTGYSKARSEQEQLQRSALHRVTSVVQRQSLRLENARTLLLTLSRLREVRQGDANACAALFAQVLALSPTYSNICLHDSAGVLLASGRPDLPVMRLTTDLPDPARRQGISYVLLPRNDSRPFPLLVCRLPVPFKTGPPGLLTVSLTILPSSFWQKQRAERPAEGILVYDAQGRVLVSHPDQGDTPSPQEQARTALIWQSVNAVKEPQGLASVQSGRVEAFARLNPGAGNPTEQTLVLSIAAEPFQSLLREQIGSSLLLLLAALAVALTIACGLSYYSLILPARALLQAARSIIAGDMHSRIGDRPMPEEYKLLATSMDRMAAALEGRDRELVDARDAAERGNQAKTDFLANMSHEIRTPMNAILGMTYLSRQGELTAQQRVYLDSIHDEAGNLLVIINDILDFSKIEAGKCLIEETPFHLPTLLDEVLRTNTIEARRKGLAASSHFSPDLPEWLRGDSQHLSQILNNLLGSIVKLARGGDPVFFCGAIFPEPPAVILECRLRLPEGCMDAAALARLLPEEEDRKAEGSPLEDSLGLNLALTRKLVVLMRGELVPYSEETGHGLLLRLPFTLSSASEAEAEGQTLSADSPAREPELAEAGAGAMDGQEAPTAPGQAAPGQAAPGQAASGAAVLHGVRVLLVEDNPVNQQIAGEVLAGLGADVSAASNGLQALSLLDGMSAAHPWHVVLMDLQMPEMDGFDATRRIRMDERFKALPVLAMTAQTRDEEWRRCREAGMDDFVSKPFEVSDLSAKIRHWALRKRDTP